MNGLYKFGLAAGLIGIFCYGGCRIKSEVKQIRERLPQIVLNFNHRQSHLDKRLDRIEESFRGQLALMGVMGQYDLNKNKIIDKDEYDKYIEDVLQVERILKKYDTDSTEFLNREELYRLLKDYMSELGVSKRYTIESVLKHVIKRYDKDRNGLLDRVELNKLIIDYEREFSTEF